MLTLLQLKTVDNSDGYRSKHSGKSCQTVLRCGPAEGPDGVEMAMADPLNVIAIDTVTKIKSPLALHLLSGRSAAIEQVYHSSDLDQQRLLDLVELEVSTELPNR